MKFDSNTGRAAVLLLGLSAALSGTASAQTSTTATGVTLATGSWATTIQATVNGRNSTELLQKVQLELAKKLPSGMKESTIAKLNDAKTRVRATTCITRQTATAISSPAALFSRMSKMNPLCTFTAGRVTANTQFFSGRCYDPLSFAGNVTGKLVVDNATTWRSTFGGTGKVPDPVLKAFALPANSTVYMQTVATSRLNAATCPATTTTVASAR